MSNPVDAIRGAGVGTGVGTGTEYTNPRTEPNRTVDRSYAPGTDLDLQEIPLQGDDDLDLEQEDPMAAQYADTAKQIGMNGGAFLKSIN